MGSLFLGAGNDAEISADHPHILKPECDLLIQRGQIEIIEPAPGFATQNTRCHISQKLIDEPRLEQHAAQARAAFDMHFVDTAICQRPE